MMDIETKIKELVSCHSGVKIEKLSNETLIEEDLGTTGDDVWELLEDIHKQLNVNLSELDFELHFSPEVSVSSNESYGYYPVSIGHLIDVAKNQKWFMPPRNEDNYSRVHKRIQQSRFTNFLIFILFAGIGVIWFSIK